MGKIMTYEDRIKAIEDEVTKSMAKAASDIVKVDFERLNKERKKIDPLLRRIERHLDKEGFYNEYQRLLNIYGTEDKINKKQLKAYINTQIFKINGEKNNKKALLKDFKDAFKLATNIRQIVTGEKITFSVVTQVGNNKIGTVELNTTQMLRTLEIDLVASKKMKDNIFSAIKTVQGSIKQKTGFIRKTYSTQSNLYKSVSNFFDAATRYTGDELTEGHRWELYLYFYNKYNGEEDTVITDTEQLLRGYLTSKLGYAWYKGGDVGNLQVKYKQSSFTSFNSVVTILNKFKETFDKVEKWSDESKATKKLQSLFLTEAKKQSDDIAFDLNKFLVNHTVEELDRQFKQQLQGSGITVS